MASIFVPRVREEDADSGLRWTGDWTSLADMLLLLLIAPFTVVSVAVITALPAVYWLGLPWWIAPAVYLAFLPLLLLPSLSDIHLWLARQPIFLPAEDQQRRMVAVFLQVREDCDQQNRDFELFATPEKAPNAVAMGGRLVGVTAGTLEYLDDDMMAGVLAHELGHHAGWHPQLLIARLWLYWPIVLLVRIVSYISLAAAGLLGGFAGGITGAVLALLGAVIMFLVWILQLLVLLPQLAFMFVSRAAEHQADRWATDHGYGPQLLAVLDVFVAIGGDGRRFSGLWDTHPPLSKRQRRITRRMKVLAVPDSGS